MAKFIVIRKKTIINSFLSLLLITFIITFIYLNYDNNSSKTTFSLYPGDNISSDLNGDGNKDLLEIIEKENRYIVKITSNNKDYLLKTNDGDASLGECIPNWPLKITLKDLSRDGIYEIIVQCTKNSAPINLIFSWIDNNFINIYTSTDNIIGLLDSSNSKTPKFLSLSSRKGDSSTSSIILNDTKIKDISFSNTTVPGLASIQSFIDIIETPYEIDIAPDIFSPYIDSSELSILWNLDKELYNYSFQNGFFTDIKWDSTGSATSLQWSLSFENTNKSHDNAPKEELILCLTMEKDMYDNFKISSIKK